jgi:hypothetical protein
MSGGLLTNQGTIPAKWSALTPRGTAIVDVPNGRRITWRDFDERVTRLHDVNNIL